ncbi:MAG: HupE/UreJ family protein, partial [Longimicrobiales bacterium]
VTRDQVRQHLDSIRGYVEPRFGLFGPDGPIPLEWDRLGSLFIENARFVQLHYRVDGAWEIPEVLEVFLSTGFDVDDDHRNMVVVEHNWRTSTFHREGEEGQVALILSPNNPRQTLDLTSSTLLRGFLGFIWLGVWHIWIGIDHILFLMALTLPAVMARRDGKWVPVESFREALFNIVAIVTFFTIAHSVTLSLAALGVVQLPSRVVESIIAASIAIAAWANLRPALNIKEWTIAFAFGLFHGFGFATVLGEIGMGREYLVLSLLGFNIGVELGQVAIILVAFPVLFALRKTALYDWIVKVGSWFLIAVALLWFFERALDFNVPLGPILLAPFRALMGGG